MAHLIAPEYGVAPRCLLCLGHGQSVDFGDGLLIEGDRKPRATIVGIIGWHNVFDNWATLLSPILISILIP